MVLLCPRAQSIVQTLLSWDVMGRLECCRQEGHNAVAVKELKQKLALNSASDMTQLQSHPIAVDPRAMTPPDSPPAGRVHESKAGFSHGRIPPNALMGPQVHLCVEYALRIAAGKRSDPS